VLEAAHQVLAMAVDTRGHAVVGIPIRIERVDGSAEGEPAARAGQSFLSGSDTAGRARFLALTAGDWRASGGSFEWELVGADPPVLRVPSDDAVRLEFRRRSRPERAGLRGEVQLAGGGVPLGLEVEGLMGGVLEVDGGRFEASGLVPTRHRLLIQAAGHRPLELYPVDMVAGGVTDLGTLVLEPATRVVVLVRDPQERSLRKARVRLTPLAESAGGVGLDERALDCRHEGAGRFSTEHAPRAAWSLRVSCPGFRPHEQTVFVEPVEQQQWTVRLLPAE